MGSLGSSAPMGTILRCCGLRKCRDSAICRSRPVIRRISWLLRSLGRGPAQARDGGLKFDLTKFDGGFSIVCEFVSKSYAKPVFMQESIYLQESG